MEIPNRDGDNFKEEPILSFRDLTLNISRHCSIQTCTSCKENDSLFNVAE